MAAAVDLTYLSAAYSYPKDAFQTLVDEPTQELVNNLLRQLTTVAKQNESIQADKLRTDIQLETAIRNGDSRAKQLKASAEKSLRDTQELREKLNEAENTRAILENKLQDLRSSTHTSSSDADALQARITSLESSNRDTVALLDRKSTTNDKLAEELNLQQQKIVTLRREISSLEEKLQKAENASLSTKFREQSLQQEVTLLKKNNEWQDDELRRRTAEHTKVRKEKASQIAELQRASEEASSSIDTLRRSEASLKARVEEVTQKLEDSFRKVQLLQEEATKSQDAFRLELDNARRLAELQKQSAATSRARLQDVQQDLDNLRDDAAAEIGQLQAEVESERAEKEALDSRAQDMEAQVEQLETDLVEARRTVSRPTTPRRTNGHASGRDSPGLFSSPGASRLKGSLNMTQLYSEHSQMRSDLDAERRRNEKLRATLDEMIRELERKQPEIEEQRQEYERIQSDLNEMTELLETTISERNEHRKESRALQGDVASLNQEGNLLRQQLRDLSMQIKVLLAEAQFRIKGLDSLSAVDRALYDQVVAGEIQTPELDEMSATGRLISQRLVIFRDVSELQEQNLRLGHLTRKLGEEMEGEEAQAKHQQQEQVQKELEETQERMVRYQDEIKSLTVRSESYVRERDMYRRMLSHRGQLPPDADLPSMFGQSLGASASSNSLQKSTAQAHVNKDNSSDATKDLSDYNRLLKEMQQQYDSYRQEAGAEYNTIKDQLSRTAKEKSELQSELAKTASQVSLGHDRYELLQSNVSMLKSENGELQKRSSSLAEAAARQDIRTQQVAEELVEARSLAEGLRHENANIKAERELWKKIELRIEEDNRQLLEERGRLNKMLVDLQNLQNERELSDTEARRRLQNRVDSLESEAQTTKRKLDEESNENKKAVMRREFEQDQSRTRIEDLLKALANTREELASAKTARDQLQARVDELSVELRAAHEKEAALQPLLTSGARSGSGGTQDEQENRLSAEQELTIQVSDLKRDLELAKNEIHQASQHVEQYKTISQAAEDELQTLTDAHDEFKAEMDRLALERDGKIQDLEARVEELSAELASTSIELTELKDQQGSYASSFNEQKVLLEADIARLRDDSDRFAEKARLHQEDLKAQAEIAQRAQQAYEDELVKHAEAAKQLQAVRVEYNVLKTEVTGFKTEAEASKASLVNSEESWSDSRSRYEAELAELRTRREDVISQNRRLHDQLESVTKQIDELKKTRPTNDRNDVQPASNFDANANREEIITWLKKDKEIIEVQYELSKQEVTRYKQKLHYTESQLDEAREKLSQERQSQSDRDQSTMSHNKLVESINQLNLFRESNASLRSEARQAQSQLADRIKEVEDLSTQLYPLRSRVRELENDIENKDGEAKLLQEDRDRLQKRIQDIFSKHQRIDPAELEALKTRANELEAERNDLITQTQELQTRVDSNVEASTHATAALNEVWEGRKKKLIDTAKAKAREQSGIIRDKDAEIAQLQSQKSRIEEELDSTKAEMARLTELSNSSVTNTASTTAEEGEVNEGPELITADSAAAEVVTAQAAAKTAEERAINLQRDSDALTEVIKALETQVTDLQGQLGHAQQQILNVQQLSNISENNNEDAAKLRAELEAVQRELEQMKTSTENQVPVSNSNVEASMNVDILEQKMAERTAQIHAELAIKEKTLQEQFNARAEKMKGQLQTRLKENRERNEALVTELRAELASALERRETDVASTPAKEEASDEKPASETAVVDPALAVADLSEEQIKKLVASNSTILEMVKRNVQIKLKTAQEQLTADFQKKSEESKVTFESEKKEAEDKARMLEGKKFSVKFNIQERKLASVNAQVSFLEAAARETPQRAVSEVWALAKDAKPTVPIAPGDISQSKLAAVLNTSAQSVPHAQSGATPTITPSAAIINPFGAGGNAAPTPNPFSASGAPVTANAPKRAPSLNTTSGIPQGLPPKPAQGRGQGQRQVSGSAIPRPGSSLGQNQVLPAAGRGSGIPRGGLARGGRAGARGGASNPRGGSQLNARAGIATGAPGSPSNLNPSAAQFAPGTAGSAPGTKRPHDGGGGNAEKRPKP